MKIFLKYASIILIFFSCKKEKEAYLSSDQLVEVLGPKEKGVFDSINVPLNIKEEVKSISSLNYFDTGVIGKGNPDIESVSPFSEFEKLKIKADIKELYRLTFNKNLAVSLYSSIAVAEKIPNLAPVFYSRLLNVKQKIYSENGCLVGDLNPSEIFYNEYLRKVDENQERTDLILQKLDSISIYSKNTTTYVLNQALRHRIYPESFQDRLEELAFAEENPYTLLYLSRNFRERYKNRLEKSIVVYLKKVVNEQYSDYSKNKLTVELMKFKNPDNKDLIERLSKNNSILRVDEEDKQLKKSNGITN
ncbi:hypothetical protein [Epilithonimonas vandammei]|uniref:hypothetical protein n=1 Tax=Epilithonimonas vandammei TaxID=2487072 RepID=UPI0028B13CE7|nr:hypothetical protein [Epilithonimonas vandammei]